MPKIAFSDISIRLIKSTFSSRFTLARLCKKSPVIAKIVNKLLFEGDDIQVIPRDRIFKKKGSNLHEIKIDTDIPVINDTVIPSQVLKEMIIKSRYHFVMDFCICRVSNDCKDFPHNLGCLFLGRGAKRISSKLGRMVTAEEALEHINRCQEAGLLYIIGRNKIDSVWLNTGPKEELLSICNCCPCCCLWKMAPQLPENIGKSLTPMNGVQIKFNQDLCRGCGICASGICFVDAITVDEKARRNSGMCRACGRCVEICTQKAFTLEITDDAVEKSIERVDSLVDLKCK